MTIKNFCDLHDACDKDKRWALSNCKTMQQVWETAHPNWLTWIATRTDVLDDRTLRKFAVWSARQVQHLISNPLSIAALDVAERHTDGLATDDEMKAARNASRYAARDATYDAARIAAWDAADGASYSPAWVAARSAAWDSARAAASDAIRTTLGAEQFSAYNAAFDAARAAQAAWLRANATPNFERAK